jgi:hypothetical protein
MNAISTLLNREVIELWQGTIVHHLSHILPHLRETPPVSENATHTAGLVPASPDETPPLVWVDGILSPAEA